MPDYKTLRLDEVFVDATIQPRVNGLDEDHVAEIEAAYRAGQAVEPPVVWFLPDETYWLSQGYHRIAAMGQAGMTEAKFCVRTGSPDDWFEDAQTSNKSHGLKRSNADKRKAATNMLTRFPNRSDRAIAESLGVSQPFIGEVRSVITVITPGQPGVATVATPAQPAMRIGRDGHERPATQPPRPAVEPTTTHTSTEKTTTTEPAPPPVPVANPGIETVMCPHCLGAGRIPKPKPVANLYDAPGMPPLPANLDTPEFILSWELWLHDRKKRGKKVQPNAAMLQLRDLSAHGQKVAIEAIETSIKNGWTGLFPGKESTNGKQTGGRSTRDHNPSRVTAAPGDFDGCDQPDIVVG